MTDRALISKTALRKLPTKADDGTPYCASCRKFGELNRMVSTDGTGSLQCEAWSLPVYADTDRLSYEQMTAGEACRGCGQEVLPRGEAPSWVGKGTLYFTDEERAAHQAAEEAFTQRHPYCHALRWTVQLDCGHVDEQVTPLDWKIEDGYRQTAPNDPDEVAWRTARMERVKDCVSPGEYARALRQIEQGHLVPDPLTACWLCGYERPIVAFQRVGWLVPAKPVPATPAPEAPTARPTRAQLEQRVAELQAEIARLKGSDPT